MPVDHYENFPVASFLVPAPLRRPIEVIYRFARSADDIADEGDATPADRLAGLAAYQAELDRIAAGMPPLTPLFADLAAVIRAHALPVQLFRDLLDAFAQDVVKKRYADYPELLDYCRRSANPVGRLVLHLTGRTAPEQLAQSDCICTALQLVNFWQDVAVDWQKGRVYLPQGELPRFRVGEDDIAAGRWSANWAALMDFQTDRARDLMLRGAPLVHALPGRIGWEIRLTVQGGLRILERIRRVRGDVFRSPAGARQAGLARASPAARLQCDAMTPDQYCQEKCAASGSSFYYSFLFLPAERRRAIMALYAFCREVDDVVDECNDPAIAATKLAWWRQEIGRLAGGQPQHPVGQALQTAAARFDLPAEQLLEIIDGMEMDLQQSRYLDFKGLSLYCYRVASVVGLLAAGIFGYGDRQTQKYAHDLGMAFQLTNIVRDIGEDARRGRIYLPMDELKRFDVPAADILNARYSDNFSELMKFQVERAEKYYAQAVAQLPAADRKNQRPGLVMAAIYRTLLDEIRRDDYRVLHQRIALTPVRKLWIAWKTWVFA